MAEELDVNSIFKFKVDELKQELAKRGLPKGGSKADLQERLLQYVTSKLYTDESVITDDTSNEDDVGTELKDDTLDDDYVVSDAIEEECSKPEDDSGGGDTEILNDEFIDKTTNDVNTSNDENFDNELDTEYKTVDQTDFTRETSSADDESAPDKESSLEPTSEKKFCRVTITSPNVSELEKKENRHKRFGSMLSDSESDRKKARLGRFSSMSMMKGEEVTEQDIEKIKKRAERFGSSVSSILTTSVHAGKDRLQSRQERFADEHLKKRQERFGVINTKSLDLSPDMEARKQNRLSKFGAGAV